MKKITFLTLVLIAFAFNAFAQNNDVNPLSSVSEGPKSYSNNSQIDALGALLRNWNIDSLTPGAVGGYGVVWTGSNYIVSEFNANKYYRFTANWARRDSFTVTGGSGSMFFRDMAFAKGRLWGVNTTGQIFGVDTGTFAVVKTITTTVAQLRAITWDPIRNGFWVGTTNFTGPLVCVDTNGVTIPGASIVTPASGLYGVGYDNDPAGPFLWIGTDQTPASTTGTSLQKYNATTLAAIGGPVNITVPLTVGAATGLASGGGEVYNDLVPGKRTWVGVVQGTPDRVITVELSDLPTPPAGSDSTIVILNDTVNTGNLASKKADNDSLMKQVRAHTRNYRVWYKDLANVPSFRNYKNMVYVETSNITTNFMTVAMRDSIKAFLNSGTPSNKKGFFAMSGDFGYNYDRTGAPQIDTVLTRQMMGFKYVSDNATTTTIRNIIGMAINTGVIDTLVGNTLFYPEGITSTNGGVPTTGFVGRGTVDTVNGMGKISANFTTAVLGCDPRYISARGTSQGFAALYRGYMAYIGATVTGIVNNPSIVADKYSLSQNYPNPFNPTTKITFAIPTTGFVSLKVYNITGQEVMTLVNKSMTVGSYTVDFNGLALSSGAYFYKLESGSFVETKKMLLVK